MHLRDIVIQSQEADVKVSSILMVGICRRVPDLNLLLVVRASCNNSIIDQARAVIDSNISRVTDSAVRKYALDHESTVEWQVRELGTSWEQELHCRLCGNLLEVHIVS